jgi:hypothetical protein
MSHDPSSIIFPAESSHHASFMIRTSIAHRILFFSESNLTRAYKACMSIFDGSTLDRSSAEAIAKPRSTCIDRDLELLLVLELDITRARMPLMHRSRVQI